MRSEQVRNQRSEMVKNWTSDPERVSWLIDFKKYKMSHCHLYFIGPENPKVVKVGISVNPYKRLIDIQTGCWAPVSIQGSFWLETVHQARKLEKEIHKRLSEGGLHSAGEWFKLSAQEAVEEAVIASMDLGLKLNKHFPSEQIRNDVWDLAYDLFFRTDAHDKCNKKEINEFYLHTTEENCNRRLARLAEYGISEATMDRMRVVEPDIWEECNKMRSET
jgi:hypothetical protein